MRQHSLASIAILFCGLLALASLPLSANSSTAPAPGQAAGPGGSLSATGEGSVTIIPDVALIKFRVRARAKSIAQALTDFNDKRKLFGKTMADFADTGLLIESSGLQLGTKTSQTQTFITNGQPAAAAPFEVKEVIEARLPLGDDRAATLRLIAELVAAAVDVECTLDGPDSNSRVYYAANANEQTGAISFVASEEAIDAAYDTAAKLGFEKAKQRAVKLAALAGRPLGQVNTISIPKPFARGGNTSSTIKRTLSVKVVFNFAD